jgi:hypothetical protein
MLALLTGCARGKWPVLSALTRQICFLQKRSAFLSQIYHNFVSPLYKVITEHLVGQRTGLFGVPEYPKKEKKTSFFAILKKK